ncbi:metallophosphoesterase family protein [Patulibacter americanus]|uniref:metallophosphoesterase family protein n=1 Tax=Patulibacter americanus TaxID=588672 RepID=UPI0003B3E54A|nr:metallophosphoesterase [Patulibacter americanus]
MADASRPTPPRTVRPAHGPVGRRAPGGRARRRAVLVAVALLALVAGILVGRTTASSGPDRADAGSTLAVTLRDPTGSGALQPAPGEPLRDRTELAGTGAPPRPGRTLGVIAQLTDTHVRDTASPARIPFLDRLGTPFTAVFRPQEPLTLQTLAAATRTVNALRPDLTLVTGDLTDNSQENELDAAIGALRGGTVRPFDARSLQGADNADPFFYRPDVDPPRRPGLLDRARAPFRAPGLRGPVAVLPGNHDVLVGGEVRATPGLRATAVGAERLVTPDGSFARSVPREQAAAQESVNRLLAAGDLPGTTAPVRPDPRRRLLSGEQVVARLARAGLAGERAGRADAVRDVGTGVRVVLLDDVPRGGSDTGAVDAAQLAFLDRALTTGGDRWILVAVHAPLQRTPQGRAIRDRLARAPRVLATVGGDTHHDRVRPVRTAAGGYWSITTSALADWPQQGRALRVRATAGGGALLETHKLDTAPDGLADTARELAYLDAQGGRPDGNAGTPDDRNVRLYRAPPR